MAQPGIQLTKSFSVFPTPELIKYKMKNSILLCAAALLLSAGIHAQVVRQKVGNNPTTINKDAALEVESTNKGFLPPRVALTALNNPSPLSAHVAGMVVYNSTADGDVPQGLYVNNGTAWVALEGGGTAAQPEVSVVCDGFQGTWTQGTHTRSYKVTYTNNSFSPASVTPVVGDLTLSPGTGLTVASVSPNVNTSIPAGGGQLVVTYTFGGTLTAAPGTVITGSYAKLLLSCNKTVTVGNIAPVANAGPDQNKSIFSGTTSTLTGSGTDSDGTIASYSWAFTSGPTTATITTPNAATTAVTGLTTVGDYVFTLTVTDNTGGTHSDAVTIKMVNNNVAPVANAGPDQVKSTFQGSTATLTGSGTDSDGTIATYAWAFTSGPATPSITSPSSATTGVTGLTAAGDYVFTLTVTDNHGGTHSDSVTIKMVASNTGLGETFTFSTSPLNPATFSTNTACHGKTISSTPCLAVSGVTLNDNTSTTVGTEYNWTGATGLVAGGTVRALVEIGGQCWYARNADNAPATGFSWYYNDSTNPNVDLPNEGRLYQFTAAMSSATTEKAQGICPSGWVIPSDCDWKHLEHNLGMSVGDQNSLVFRGDNGTATSVGSRMSTLVPSGNNVSGFTGLMTGNHAGSGFLARGEDATWWTSTISTTGNAYTRGLDTDSRGSSRFSNSTGFGNGYSVRCLKY